MNTDPTLAALTEYTVGLQIDAIPLEVVHQVARTYVDSLGCMAAGTDAAPAQIAASVARTACGAPPARVLGRKEPSTVELAAFANGVMLRYLDFNDMYMAARDNNGHPSDAIAGVLTLGDALGMCGRDLVLATVLAYDIFCELAESIPLVHFGGWDRGLFNVVAIACAASRMLKLDAATTGHAIALAVVPHVPLAVTRIGTLSMWKGCALAESTRAGLLAVRMAQHGMTGPCSPFAGHGGLWQQVIGEQLDPPAFNGHHRILETHFKHFPSEWHTQCPATVAAELHPEVQTDTIVRVLVETYHAAIRTAGDPAKWTASSRETADHSIPYVVAASLARGPITSASFDEQMLRSPGIGELMGKVVVCENPDFERRYPNELHCRITVETADGARRQAHTAYPKGHRARPMTDSELETKFTDLAAHVLPDAACADAVLDLLWRLPEVEDVRAILDCFVPAH